MRWSTLPLLLLSGCTGAERATPLGERIVSIDYCADQMVLGLAERRRIAAVSHEAANDPLFAGRLATGLPRVRPDVEQILSLRPTLVVRSYAGGGRLETALARAGVRVFTLPYAATLADVRRSVAASGVALRAQGAAQQRLARLDRELAAAPAARDSALYTTPGSYTAGPDTLIGEMIDRAGHRNAEQRPGWHRLDIEQLVTQPPRLIIRAFGESSAHQTDRWSSSDHRALRAAFADSQQVSIPGSWVACGNWRIGHAVARLRQAGAP
jgi:iron complex transport system substrate-binding protein